MRIGFLLSIATTIFVMTSLWSPLTQAQEEEASSEISTDVDQIANEIEKQSLKQKASPNLPAEQEEKLEDFSGLGKLAPFSEISVIQKRFLPKTQRFEFLLGLTQIMNDPWFMGIGVDTRLGYHFTENWGLELAANFLTNSESQSVRDLNKEHDVRADTFVVTKGYYGASVVWTPIYGKMGLSQGRIIPFDMYFQAGGGLTQVDNGEGGSTLHFGTGQIFALSKAYGFRWDFSWNSYNAKPTGAVSQSFNNLMLTFGVSFFFPEAQYR